MLSSDIVLGGDHVLCKYFSSSCRPWRAVDWNVFLTRNGYYGHPGTGTHLDPAGQWHEPVSGEAHGAREGSPGLTPHHYQHLHTQSQGMYPCKMQGAPPSPGEKLVEGDAGGGGGGGGGGGALYPPYPVPCSQSPGGTWTAGSVPPTAPHFMPGGQPSPGHPGHPGQHPGQPPQQHQQQQSGQSGGGGGQATLPSPLYPWMRSQFGNGKTQPFFTSCTVLQCSATLGKSLDLSKQYNGWRGVGREIQIQRTSGSTCFSYSYYNSFIIFTFRCQWLRCPRQLPCTLIWPSFWSELPTFQTGFYGCNLKSMIYCWRGSLCPVFWPLVPCHSSARLWLDCFREEERPADLHSLSDFRTWKGISF